MDSVLRPLYCYLVGFLYNEAQVPTTPMVSKLPENNRQNTILCETRIKTRTMLREDPLAYTATPGQKAVPNTA